MRRSNQTLSAVLAMCLLLPFADTPVKAQYNIGPSKGEVAGVAIGIAAVGAAIGIGVYYAVKHNHGLTGCALSGPNGMTLTSESDKRTYALTGAVAGIKSGDRVRVSGKKIKQKSAGTPQFIVEKVSRDFGGCKSP